MKAKKYTALFLRKRKFLLLAPVGIVFLLTILFMALGGGKGKGVQPAGAVVKGANMNLPPAHLKDESKTDKLAYYKRAERDSVQTRELKKAPGSWGTRKDSVEGADSVAGLQMHGDPNEEKVKRKVAEVRAALDKTSTAPVYRGGTYPTLPEKRNASVAGSDIDRLERMMGVMKEGQSGSSPEMRDLNRTLDKLMAVQHPGLIPDTVGRKAMAVGPEALPVNAASSPEAVSGWSKASGSGNRFYDLESSSGEGLPEGAMMEAVVPVEQTLVNGAMIRLELETELVIKGISIPRGTPLYGVGHLNNERLMVAISSIRYKEQVFPVNLQVLDQDGLAGIYEPGSITREVMKESAGEGVSGVGVVGIDPSLGAQAASAGIQMARSLVGKKVRMVRVTVKAGYRVFLQDMGRGR
jgi:conjugative transposon TraM protein